MPSPATPTLWTRLLTGLIAGLVVCTLLAALAAVVGLVFGLMTRHPSTLSATLRLIGLIYLVYVPLTMIRYAFFPRRPAEQGTPTEEDE